MIKPITESVNFIAMVWPVTVSRFTIILFVVVALCCLLLWGNGNLFHKVNSKKTDEPKDYVKPEMQYAVVVDAGSSGSRVYIYVWPPHSGNQRELLDIQQLRNELGEPYVKKIEPGLSSFADRPQNATSYVRPLLDYALRQIPQYKHKGTFLYILATAGMRLLPKMKQDAILKNLRNEIRNHFPFILVDDHIEVITGKQEGIYSWISVNYLLKRFQHVRTNVSSRKDQPQQLSTVGTLDMGGASMQIAFQLPPEVYANAAKDEKKKKYLSEINLGCDTHDSVHKYHIYVATYLGYGGNIIHRSHLRHLSSLVSRNLSKLYGTLNETLPTGKLSVGDPCYPVDYVENLNFVASVNNRTVDRVLKISGTGDFDSCKRSLVPLLNESNRCDYEVCKMNGMYHPEDKNQPNLFYGFSEFWYTTEDVLRMGGTYSKKQFEQLAQDYCRTSWNVLKHRYRQKLYPMAGTHRLRTQCFKSAWMSAVLHRGFDFPISRRLITASRIEGQSVQWTLGALLFRTRFYPLRSTVENVTTHSTITRTWIPTTPLILVNHYILSACFVVVLAFILYFIRRLRKMSSRQRMFSQLPMSKADLVLHEKRSWAIRHDVDF